MNTALHEYHFAVNLTNFTRNLEKKEIKFPYHGSHEIDNH